MSLPPPEKRLRGNRGGQKHRPSRVLHSLVYLYNFPNQERRQALVDIRKQYRKFVAENAVELRLSDGAVEQDNKSFAVTASLREKMSCHWRSMCEIVDRVCRGNKCVQRMEKHRANEDHMPASSVSNSSHGVLSVPGKQTDKELFYQYGLAWSVIKTMAEEKEDSIERLIFGDSETAYNKVKWHAKTAGIDPPTCSQCKFARWPARKSNNGNWICCSCSVQGSLKCHACSSKSWNGYNRPWWEGGKWLCAECWSKDSGSYHVFWKEWFLRRVEKYPIVATLDVESQVVLQKQKPSYKWDPSLARGCIEAWCSSVTEVNLGKKGWNKFEYCGYLDDAYDESIVLPENFLGLFLETRPDAFDHSLSLRFHDPFPVGDRWQYHQFKRHDTDDFYRSTMTGYHATRWFSVYNILVNGFHETTEGGKSDKKGVYWYEQLYQGWFYHRYHLMPNGCAFCVVAHIACKKKTTESAGKGQKATPKDDVHLLGFLVRGYTMHELKALSGRESLTLVEMWDPRMEQNPWTSR